MQKHLQKTLQQYPQLQNAKRIWIGFSGGVDSSVLLHALASEPHLKPKLQALHIHHGLSQHADQWVQHCEQACTAHGVALHVERVDVSEQGSLEQQARAARYDVFESYVQHDDVLVLGHHQDDQVETFMMRLMRGSGLTGLTAMEDERPLKSGLLVRPLLSFSRQQIEGYAQQQGLNWVEDESNQDTSLDRNWWRNALLPALEARYPQARQSLLKTLTVLQDELALLQDLLQPVYQEVVDEQGCLSLSALGEQAPSLQNQIVRMWQAQRGHYPLLNDVQIQQLLNDFLNSRDDAEPLFEWQSNEANNQSGHQIRRYQDRLHIMAALPEPKPFCFELDLMEPFEQTIPLPFGVLSVVAAKEGLKPNVYELINYNGALKAKPEKRPSKTLKKWFQELGVAPWLRPHWPVLMHQGEVAAIPGLFICEGYGHPHGLSLMINQAVLNKK